MLLVATDLLSVAALDCTYCANLPSDLRVLLTRESA